ncbi:glycosyltransferase [Cyanobium sp. HWJ4-Hawea]|uniref:glycosyltransferase n=1 Tax=Cyanobium sp. HWJ4-Hawea TaxID=2823713 RepID=UPI0020CDA056|nr:glycosyltransferase [Cyanobium sp. HWJ4-Hawea]MCP9808635.1 glycosyltransferase [Cyanobium sp. HWJ4-Hawea]
MRSACDVSIILNIHREATYLRPTLRSLDACAAKATNLGITVELVAVFDQADDATKQVFACTELRAFCQQHILEVFFSSLGPSRNAGIAMALGEYIWIVDADDLYSSNSICSYMSTIGEHRGRHVVLFPDYLAAFGDRFFVVRYFPSTELAPADFACQHSYVSNIFMLREHLKRLHYCDLPLTPGFAYEDWHLNCQLLALGFCFLIAPETILFYRQRPSSLLACADSISSRLIPHTNLFDPEHFSMLMGKFRDSITDWSGFLDKRQQHNRANNTADLFACGNRRGLLEEVCRLEPEIDLRRLQAAESLPVLPADAAHWGFELETLFALIGASVFTDVVLLPWLKPGGSEKHILQVVDAIRSQQPEASILVVTGEWTSSHEWLNRLSECDAFVDLCGAFPQLTDDDRNALLMRALLALTCPPARLHFKASIFGHRFIDRYGPALSNCFKLIYYRFCDDHYLWGDQLYPDPGTIRFLRRHNESIHLIVADCESIIYFDRKIFAPKVQQHQLLYNLCEQQSTPKLYHKMPCKRLLWASRICAQKNPWILPAIIENCRVQGLEIKIDVYGNYDEDFDQNNAIFKDPALAYRGSFSGFSSIDTTGYDALLYTTHFDGMPNVILEAMARGLLVVAPVIGGVEEAIVHHENGLLVRVGCDVSAWAAAYAQALKMLYRDWEDVPRMAANARVYVESRHGYEAFYKSVSNIFFSNFENGKNHE